MKIWPDTLEDASWTVTADVDLTSATADVYLAGGWHALTWTAAPVQDGQTWTRTGKLLIAGANPGTGVKPTADDEYPLTRVTVGGRTIIRQSDTSLDLVA